MNLLSIRVLLAASFLIVAAPVQAAAPKLNKLFSDHMVLQQGKTVPVWGWAEAGDKITVQFADQSASTVANADGTWRVDLKPLAANAEPAVLKVSSNAYDGIIKVSDVLVGEVWLGSGQSNMAMTVSRAQDYEAEQAAADLPLIRVFKESSPAASSAQADPKGTWTLCSPETVGGYSATAFFMGRELHKKLGVPVGLVVSAVGGTPIENWIDAEKQQAVPELEEFTTTFVEQTARFDAEAAAARFAKQLEAWKENAAKAKAAGKPTPRRPRDPVATHRAKGGPGDLFNGKIAPLVPYAIRGAIWYQGEANSRPEKSQLYVHHMPTLVTEWRGLWGDEFAFGIVQLPNFEREGEGWMEVREAMLKTAQSLPRTGVAITVDVGDPKDIHPKNKQAVGQRLAQWALVDVYGHDAGDAMGPLPETATRQGKSVAVSFSQATSGLVAKGGDLTGFDVADSSGEWYPANAQIKGASVVVTCPQVKRPTKVRYAWADDPKCNLFNNTGLPASPFRLDVE